MSKQDFYMGRFFLDYDENTVVQVYILTMINSSSLCYKFL